MNYVGGRVFKDPSLPGLSKEERRQIYYAAVEVLAKIHKVDIKEAELEDFGKSGTRPVFRICCLLLRNSRTSSITNH